MIATSGCYLSFNRRTAFWGADASSVQVKAFCLHELADCFYGLTTKRKVRCRKMRQPAGYKRALPGMLSRHPYLYE